MPRWTITVDEDTDRAIRTVVARNGGKKGDLSKFVTEAARKAALWSVVDEAREQTKDVDPDELTALIDEAVEEVRAERRGGVPDAACP